MVDKIIVNKKIEEIKANINIDKSVIRSFYVLLEVYFYQKNNKELFLVWNKLIKQFNLFDYDSLFVNKTDGIRTFIYNVVLPYENTIYNETKFKKFLKNLKENLLSVFLNGLLIMLSITTLLIAYFTQNNAFISGLWSNISAGFFAALIITVVNKILNVRANKIENENKILNENINTFINNFKVQNQNIDESNQASILKALINVDEDLRILKKVTKKDKKVRKIKGLHKLKLFHNKLTAFLGSDYMQQFESSELMDLFTEYKMILNELERDVVIVTGILMKTDNLYKKNQL